MATFKISLRWTLVVFVLMCILGDRNMGQELLTKLFVLNAVIQTVAPLLWIGVAYHVAKSIRYWVEDNSPVD